MAMAAGKSQQMWENHGKILGNSPNLVTECRLSFAGENIELYIYKIKPSLNELITMSIQLGITTFLTHSPTMMASTQSCLNTLSESI
jgi:hypothetical protein